MEKEILEVVLKKNVKDSSIKRIIDICWESALPEGENYTSTILRATLKAVLGNGRILRKTFICKKENTGVAADRISLDVNLFRLESEVYSYVLREMDYLMEEFADTEGPLWCDFIHYIPSNGIIILEDLKAAGFRTVQRQEMQDLDHARLVLRSLGRYHAMAKVLEGRGFISKENYQPYIFLYNESFIRNFIYGGRQALIKGMKTGWGEKWAETANELSKISLDDFLKRIGACAKLDDDTFKCLNHGDCWNNNMMFKYSWDGRPVAVRLLDFQLPHYNSPCVDVAYYLYSSVRPEVRRRHYTSFLQLYHDSLTSYLDKFGYQGPKPSYEEINNTMEKLTFFGLSFFAAMFPIFQTKTTNGMDMDAIFKSNGMEGISTSIYYEDGIREKLAEDIKRILKLQEES